MNRKELKVYLEAQIKNIERTDRDHFSKVPNARPRRKWFDFLKGMGSVLDIWPEERNRGFLRHRWKLTPAGADSEALRSDWQRIGMDMQRIITVLDPEQKTNGQEEK